MLTYLFEQGVSPNTRHPEAGETMLYIAALRGSKHGVKTLLPYGANVHLEGGEYGSALHAAAVSGTFKSLELLLLAGADVNARSERVGAPLIAVMAQKRKYSCFAAYKYSYSRYCYQCCARVLMDWDADVDAQDGEFGTALQTAEKVGNKKGIEMHLEDE
jgi:ankyrin repeat protein